MSNDDVRQPDARERCRRVSKYAHGSWTDDTGNLASRSHSGVCDALSRSPRRTWDTVCPSLRPARLTTWPATAARRGKGFATARRATSCGATCRSAIGSCPTPSMRTPPASRRWQQFLRAWRPGTQKPPRRQAWPRSPLSRSVDEPGKRPGTDFVMTSGSIRGTIRALGRRSRVRPPIRGRRFVEFASCRSTAHGPSARTTSL